MYLKQLVLVLTIISLVFFTHVFIQAHQPRLVPASASEVPVEIKNYEISQAFYGILTGKPHRFIITAPSEFTLYLNLLAPSPSDIPEKDLCDLVIDIKSKNFKKLLSKSKWEEFYEHFAGDTYFKGPEFESRVPGGVYDITVKSKTNMGKYILAVGKIESFPIREIIHTYQVLPSIKKNFFGKSPIMAFLNLFTLLLIVIFGLIIGVLITSWYLVKKVIKNFKKIKKYSKNK